MKLISISLHTALILLTCSLARADDWPQFRGPARDGVSRETNLRKSWPQGGPPLIWSISNLGLGYSGPAIVGDRLYVSVGREDAEYVIALDLKSAGASGPKELWTAKIGPLFKWTGNNWNRGPNASPTVDADRVYALGGFGDLVCVDAATGAERWRKNFPREMGGEVNPIGGGAEDPSPLGWGYAWAPLVDGKQLVCVPGGKQGTLAALDKLTGNLIWRSAEVKDQASYSSPIAADVGGVRQYIQVLNSGIVGIAASDGKKLWAYHRDPAYDDVVIATPVFDDNYVFSTVAFGQGCDLIHLNPTPDGIHAKMVFSNHNIENRDGGVVLVGEHLFGFSENHGWFCADFKTGKLLWSDRKSFGRGSITAADGHLYCAAEKGGMVALIEASPTGWTETGRLTLPKESANRRPSGGMWTHPVIANGRMYLRDQELLYCYDLK